MVSALVVCRHHKVIKTALQVISDVTTIGRFSKDNVTSKENARAPGIV